jgi:tetratricopeptide (TPR) repeat protein
MDGVTERRRVLASLGAPALLVLAVCAVYGQTVGADFLDWDDNGHVYENEHIIGGRYLQAWRHWKDVSFYPVTFTSFYVEWHVTGGRPWLFHLDNILLHAGNAVLVARLAQAIGLARGAAWAAAGLWALHPMQVATVAWISERKNVLFVFFYLACLLVHIRALDVLGRRSRALHVIAAACGLAALLSKATALTLPAGLALTQWVRRRPFDRACVLRVLAYGLMSGAVGLLHVSREQVTPLGGLDLATRMFVAARAVWFYVLTFLWPAEPTAIYPRWDTQDSWWWGVPSLAGLAAVLATMVWKRRRVGRPAWFAVSQFILNVSPIVGVVPFPYMQFSYVADHLGYFPSIGLALLVVLGGRAALGSIVPPRLVVAATGLLLVALGTLTWRHAWAYRDSQTLWEDTIAKNPDAWVAHLNLGVIRANQGRRVEAIDHYRRAIAVNPFGPALHVNLGNALLAEGRPMEAIASYREALRIDPEHWDAQVLLGASLIDAGEPKAAVAHLLAATRALPHEAGPLRLLGRALAEIGEHAHAIRAYELALTRKPDDASVRAELAKELGAEGRVAEAVVQYRAALASAPSDATIITNLAALLASLGRENEVLAMLREEQNRAPEDARLANLLAWYVATGPAGVPAAQAAAAVQQAERACVWTGNNDPRYLDTLAAAYAAAGRFADAAATARRAVALAVKAGNADLGAELDARRRLYEQGRPYRRLAPPPERGEAGDPHAPSQTPQPAAPDLH